MEDLNARKKRIVESFSMDHIEKLQYALSTLPADSSFFIDLTRVIDGLGVTETNKTLELSPVLQSIFEFFSPALRVTIFRNVCKSWKSTVENMLKSDDKFVFWPGGELQNENMLEYRRDAIRYIINSGRFNFLDITHIIGCSQDIVDDQSDMDLHQILNEIFENKPRNISMMDAESSKYFGVQTPFLSISDITMDLECVEKIDADMVRFVLVELFFGDGNDRWLQFLMDRFSNIEKFAIEYIGKTQDENTEDMEIILQHLPYLQPFKHMMVSKDDFRKHQLAMNEFRPVISIDSL